MTTVIVIVINESLDSKEQVRAVFLQLDVNVLVFYRFPKSFNPNVVFGAASASASSQSAPCSPSLSSPAICVMTRALPFFAWWPGLDCFSRDDPAFDRFSRDVPAWTGYLWCKRERPCNFSAFFCFWGFWKGVGEILGRFFAFGQDFLLQKQFFGIFLLAHTVIPGRGTSAYD